MLITEAQISNNSPKKPPTQVIARLWILFFCNSLFRVVIRARQSSRPFYHRFRRDLLCILGRSGFANIMPRSRGSYRLSFLPSIFGPKLRNRRSTLLCQGVETIGIEQRSRMEADGGHLKVFKFCKFWILSQTHWRGSCRLHNLEAELGQLLGDDAMRSELDMRLFRVIAGLAIDGSKQLFFSSQISPTPRNIEQVSEIKELKSLLRHQHWILPNLSSCIEL